MVTPRARPAHSLERGAPPRGPLLGTRADMEPLDQLRLSRASRLRERATCLGLDPGAMQSKRLVSRKAPAGNKGTHLTIVSEYLILH